MRIREVDFGNDEASFLKRLLLSVSAGVILGSMSCSVLLTTSHLLLGPKWESPITSSSDGIVLGAACGAVSGLLVGLVWSRGGFLRLAMRVLLITAVALAVILAIAATIRIVDHVIPDTPGEAAALRTLATISDNEAKYAREHGGSYATFAQLVVEGYLDDRFAVSTPIVNGYEFVMNLRFESGSPQYQVNANPLNGSAADRQVNRYLLLDSSTNTRHVNPLRPASVDDPVL